MRARIAVIEDDLALRTTLRDRLACENFAVEVACDGVAGDGLVRSGRIDLVVLDLMLPDRSGLDLCRDWRQAGYTVLILMLTALAEAPDKVVGLKLGADDYLSKPFEMAELLARIEALLRRRPRAPLKSRQVGELHIDFALMRVTVAGTDVRLTAKEFRLLQYLVENEGRVVPREELLREVWGQPEDCYTRTVDVHVSSLRKKLERTPSQPQHILTVQSAGYRWDS